MKLIKESLFEFERTTTLRNAAGIGKIAQIENSAKDPIIWSTEHEPDAILDYFLNKIPEYKNPAHGYDIEEYSKLLIRGLKSNNFAYVKYATNIMINYYLYSGLALGITKYITPKVDKHILEYLLKVLPDRDKSTRVKILSILKNDEFARKRNQFYPSLRHVPYKDIDNYISGPWLKRGYILYKILELVNDAEPKLVDIQRLAFELSNTQSFNKKTNRGYYLNNILNTYKDKYHYIERIPGESRYRITSIGKEKMKELYDKLKPTMPLMFK